MSAVNTGENKATDLDEILAKFSIFGRYHVQALVLVLYAYLINSMYASNYVFAAEVDTYRCRDEGFENNSCVNLNNSQACTEWVYDNPNSFVAEFELACQDWKRTMVGSVHSFGYMVGLLFVGPLSDRLGRKLAVVVTGVLGGVLGVAKSFTSCYWLYIALSFLESAIGDLCSPMFMLSLEFVASDKRVVYQMLCNFGCTMGGIALSTTAWLFPYWRTFIRVIYTPSFLIIFYAFLLDESPRWLLSKGKKDKAIALLQKVAKKNNVKVDKNALEQIYCIEEKGVCFSTLLRSTFASKALLKRFLICLCWWMASTFVNYGMSINSVSLEGNKYVNFGLITITDIPGNILATFIMVRYRRKFPLMVCFIMAGMLCWIQAFVPGNLSWLSVAMYMAGKLMSLAYFNITYIFTSELFPTYTRNSMHALCSSLGRIGSIVAPQTPLLLQYWAGLPAIAFGSASLLAGLATAFVPDTGLNDGLPDNIQQAEAIGANPLAFKDQIRVALKPKNLMEIRKSDKKEEKFARLEL